MRKFASDTGMRNMFQKLPNEDNEGDNERENAKNREKSKRSKDLVKNRRKRSLTV